MLDGGWGVDALVGRQTRPHDDIDVFVQYADAAAFTAMLRDGGFAEVAAAYTTPDHTAWRDCSGRTADLHLFVVSAGGALLFEGAAYPADVLDDHGTIGRLAVRCLTPEAQPIYHQGYEHDDNERRNVRLICEIFGLPAPDGYTF